MRNPQAGYAKDKNTKKLVATMAEEIDKIKAGVDEKQNNSRNYNRWLAIVRRNAGKSE